MVCSNSLKTDQEGAAPWLLKQELRRLDSLLLRAAEIARVPGGHALTVDRGLFSEEVTRAISTEPLIELRREEAASIPEDRITIIASGPLTSASLAAEIGRITGTDRLFFYNSLSPTLPTHTLVQTLPFPPPPSL